MTEQKIEQVFREALSNLEADVNPEIWTNIEKGLHIPVSSTPVSGSSSILKSAGILGKMSVKSLILVSVVTVSVVGTVIYFLTKKADSTVQNTEAVPLTFNENSPAVDFKTETSAAGNERLIETKNSANEKIVASESRNHHLDSPGKSNTENSGKSAEKETGSNNPSIASVFPSNVLPQHELPAIPDKSASAATPGVNDNKTENDQPVKQIREIAKSENDPVFDTFEKYLITDEFSKQGLPNVFTPDGDGLNDVFTIKTTGLKSLEVIIFDKNGKNLFSWKSLDGEWNGKLTDGMDAPAGNYFYSLNAETVDGKICIAQSFLKLTR